jgi:hypothetical protein
LTALRFAVTLRQPPEAIFGIVADLRSYGRWLPGSGTFAGVGTISSGAIGLGTTYTDRGPLTAMRGEVTEYAAPQSVCFRQVLRMPPLPGSFTIQVRYVLQAMDLETHLERTVTVHARGVLRLLQPILLLSIWRESWRVLHTLEGYLTTPPP